MASYYGHLSAKGVLVAFNIVSFLLPWIAASSVNIHGIVNRTLSSGVDCSDTHTNRDPTGWSGLDLTYFFNE